MSFLHIVPRITRTTGAGSPAGAGGLRLPALPGRRSRRCPGGQDRPAGLRLAGQDHRAGVAGGQLRAPGGHPPAPHAHPLPQAADPGPHAEKDRCEKLLEDAHLKLSSVISDIHGVSGRDMLRAIIAGERNPEALAQKARTRMRRKIAQLREALDCSFFTPDHAFVLQMMLDNRPAHRQIAVLDERIAICASRTSGRSPSSTTSPASAQDGPGPDRRDRRGHDAPDRRAPAPGPGRPPRPGVRRPAEGKERHRTRQPLHRRHPRRGRRRSRAHQTFLGASTGGCAPACREEAQGAITRASRHHPRPPVRPRGRVPRPRHRLLRAARAHQAPREQPRRASSVSATRSPSSPSPPTPTPNRRAIPARRLTARQRQEADGQTDRL